MKTTDKSNASLSSGASTQKGREPTSGYILCRKVMAQAVKDVVRGSEKDRAEVIRWLVSEDFTGICTAAGINPGEWRIRIAELFRQSPGLRLYYAKKMLDELAD